jgi:hypothetical protein
VRVLARLCALERALSGSTNAVSGRANYRGIKQVMGVKIGETPDEAYARLGCQHPIESVLFICRTIVDSEANDK